MYIVSVHDPWLWSAHSPEGETDMKTETLKKNLLMKTDHSPTQIGLRIKNKLAQITNSTGPFSERTDASII